MKRAFYSVVLQFLFWMIFFAVARLLFLVFYQTSISQAGVGTGEILLTFFHALKLDFATSCYLMIIPVILLIIQNVFSHRIFVLINRIYAGIAVFLYVLITAGEIGLYGEWKTKLNIKALNYLRHPSEVINSAENSSIILLILFIILFTTLSIFVYNRFITKPMLRIKRNYWMAALLLFPGLPLMVVGMRGGFQEIPINQSQVYFSRHHILNNAATNNAFNLFISFIENYKNLSSNPFKYCPDDEAKAIVDEIYTIEKDTTIHILNTKRPNVVLLIMESWSADLIESLGGEPGITPEFHKLEKEGLLFDNMLSSGSRSEQGMASIFGGFPAHPISSITVQPDKHVHLPSLVQRLNKTGYLTSFYFGGQLIYGNIKSYIYYNNFNRIMEGEDFDDEGIIRGKLGVHDEFTMDKGFRDMNKEKQPFFTALFTLSSHSPYDQPMEDVFDWGKNENRYINSAYYTDRCLGEFFRKCKTTDWYKNTLFILVADHSHNSYNNWPYPTEEYHSIPMMWLGGALDSAYRGKRWHHPGSQVDIPATLLGQLDDPYDEFHWSRNLFNPYEPNFKYFGFDNGLIWDEPGCSFSYSFDHHLYYWVKPGDVPPPDVEKRGRSYLQVLYQEYLDY